MNRTFVVTGTDTDVGKTVFAAGLCGFLGARYWKPVQAGAPADSDTVAELSGAEIIPEVWRLNTPASPHWAAEQDGVTIDPAALNPPDAGDAPLVIEGAGGLMVPLTPDVLFIDVFARWQLPLILCSRTQLGTINHTLLSIEAIQRRDIPLLGVAFIGDHNESSERVIIEKSGVKRLGRLPEIAPLTEGRLAGVFAKTFQKEDFA
jgi:dethiobiotin synthetase